MTEEKKNPPPKKPGLFAKFGRKDGKFSKTASIHSVAWFLVLTLYTLQSVLQGAVIKTSWLTYAVPEFSAAAASVILGLVSTTYVSNNYLKGKQAE